MDIIFIDGGLGNQMSQYALALNRRKNGNRGLLANRCRLHNGYELDSVFGISRPSKIQSTFCLTLMYLFSIKCIGGFIRRLLNKIGVSLISESYHYGYNESIVKHSKGLVTIYYGGWHHWKYIENVRSEVQQAFSFPNFLNARNSELCKSIDWQNSIAIHIRRGDYMDPKNYEMFGIVCSEGYYKSAIEKMAKDVQHPTFYVFSNDIEWAKGLLEGYNYVCVDWNTGKSSWEDMALMSNFKNIIIANSTFSWWAAWLGRENKNVICPSYLIINDKASDIYPENWIHLK